MRLLWPLLFFLTFPVYAKGSFQLYLKGIISPSSQHTRDVYVYLPEGYEKLKRRYPVLYIHDGQNLFDPNRAFQGQTWRVEDSLNNLIKKKLIAPVIVVAIDNTPDRLEEYIFEKRGKEYLYFIKDTLKPQIDYSFRTLKGAESTGILGSSLGGLISLHAGIKLPETFGLVGALSPSIWWNDKSVLTSYKKSPYLPIKVYLDSGTVGGEEPQNVWALGSVLKERDFQRGENLLIYIQENANHSEYWWAHRFPTAIQFLFPY
jgi:predicted alpha/beta superfamily hydrolase